MPNPANLSPTATPILTHSRLELCVVKPKHRVRLCGTEGDHVAAVAVTLSPCNHVRFYCAEAWTNIEPSLLEKVCSVCYRAGERVEIEDYQVEDAF